LSGALRSGALLRVAIVQVKHEHSVTFEPTFARRE
jgi:hypothetical protein